MNAYRTCSICTYQYDLCQLSCPFCESLNAYQSSIRDLANKKITSKLQCPACTFENDLANERCVACDSNLYSERVEQKRCDYCGSKVPEHLFSEHSTNCLLSKQLIEKEEKEIKYLEEIKKMREEQKRCDHCGLHIPYNLFEEHSTNCLLSRQLIEQQQKERKALDQYEKLKNLEESCRYCSVFYPPDLLGEHSKVCPKKPAVIRPPYIKPAPRPIRPNLIEQPKVLLPEEPLIPASEYMEGQFLQKSQILRLSQLQYDAMSHMHRRSNKESNSARAEVQRRSRRLGYSVADLQNLQFYIENYAPVIVHIHIMRYMEFFINDTHYRNQFETGKSSGSLSRQSRTQWEDRLFDKKYSKAKDSERVKYGVINMTNDPKGVNCATGYGLSYMLLKESVRGRCTITDKDSSSTDARVGTFRSCLHILEKMNDRQLMSAFKAAKAMEQSSSVSSTYKEIQIHGPLEFGKDVQRLYVNKKQVQDKKFLDMVYKFSQKFGVDYQFF